MILGWKNINTFRQHMEDMNSFRRAHSHFTPVEQLKKVRVVPAPFINNPPCRTDLISGLTDDRGKTVVIPIWKLSLPKGAQN